MLRIEATVVSVLIEVGRFSLKSATNGAVLIEVGKDAVALSDVRCDNGGVMDLDEVDGR